MTRGSLVPAFGVAIVALGFTCVLASCSSGRVKPPAENPLCGFSCNPRGLADGNAAISGVPGPDAYFEAAIGYVTAADHTSAALEAELAAVRADFGIAASAAAGAELKRMGASLLAQGPSAVASQALCWVDAARLLAIYGQCDPDLNAGMTLSCSGPCRVDASAMCGRLAKQECTLTAKAEDCGTDLCGGTCTDDPDQNGLCAGACLGDCSGNCDRFARDTNGALHCAGRCAGKCSGRCQHPVDRVACRGTCEGTCTRTNPADGCDSPIEARCQPNAGRAFDCPGACGGVFDTPKGKTECQAAAQAQASYLASCDLPWARVFYAIADSAPSQAQLAYVDGLRRLEQRLPLVIVASARGKLVQSAGEALKTAASGDVKDSFRAEAKAAEIDNQTRAGLLCAQAELGRVSKALDPADRRLEAALAQAEELLTALGAQ